MASSDCAYSGLSINSEPVYELADLSFAVDETAGRFDATLRFEFNI